ncbi:VOC family protein [Streptomyces sp. NPDC059917]|uniref:VOC family protein n=1 Tax=Streptomyces sp. NPDC059917 TaxID=3347002 RepID=UPI00364E339C
MATKLGLINIIAADVPKTLAFYRRLGLDIPEAADAQDHVEVPIAPGVVIAFDTEGVYQGFDADWRSPAPRTHERQSLVFYSDTPAEVDDLYNALLEVGGTPRRPLQDAPWGERYGSLFDPNGLEVTLVATLPTTT